MAQRKQPTTQPMEDSTDQMGLDQGVNRKAAGAPAGPPQAPMGPPMGPPQVFKPMNGTAPGQLANPAQSMGYGAGSGDVIQQLLAKLLGGKAGY